MSSARSSHQSSSSSRLRTIRSRGVKQLTTLEEAGYVEIRKGFVGKRPRTTARLTRAGRAAFELHVAALQEMVARSGATILPR